MNRSTLMIVAGGFLFALLAAIAVQMIGGKDKKDNSAASGNTVPVLMASKDLKMGEELGAGSMTWVQWPEDSKFSNAIVRTGTQKPEEALKGRVKRSIGKGEPMLASLVIDNTKASFVSASIAAGKRAVSVTVNAQSSVAGFVNPGDMVDVILTYDVRLPSDEKIRKTASTVFTKMSSETILENIRVLAVDQDYKKTEAKVGKTVTLEAEPKQAETLAIALKMGSISLALRAVGDDTPAHPLIDGKAPQTTTDLRVSGVMREITKGENKAGSTTQVVRVYSGSHVNNIEVRPYTR